MFRPADGDVTLIRYQFPGVDGRNLDYRLGPLWLILTLERGPRAVSRVIFAVGGYSLWMRLWCGPLGRTTFSRLSWNWPGGYWFWSPETGWPWPGFRTRR